MRCKVYDSSEGTSTTFRTQKAHTHTKPNMGFTLFSDSEVRILGVLFLLRGRKDARSPGVIRYLTLVVAKDGWALAVA